MYCEYCYKPIREGEYWVHIEYLTKNGIFNEYYHRVCFKRKYKEVWEYGFKRFNKRISRTITS